jgi:cation diffusion facilitator family transporter
MDSPPHNTSLYREVTRAALAGLAINFLLGIVKLVGGIVSGSVALLSDALNSLGDVFSSIIVLVGLRVAQQAPDAEHPYGHTRAETIAASNVALLIIVSALFLGWRAIHEFPLVREQPGVWTLWIAGANVVIKESLYRYKIRVGKRTGSQAIVANAWDHRNDALSSFAVLIGLSVVHWGGPRYSWADGAAAMVVVAAVVWAGVEVFLSSASALMDPQASKSVIDEVRHSALAVPGVLGVEKLFVRKSGLEYFADIHIEVEPEITVAEGHRIGHLVKDRLLQQFAVVRDVLVHLEPHRAPEEHGAASKSREP